MTRLMNGWILGLLLAATAAAQQTPVGRVYFDTAGNGGDPDAPHPGSTSKVNPVLVFGGRLYIFWEFHVPDLRILAANFTVDVDGGTVDRAHFYNQANVGGTLGRRWNIAMPDPPIDNPGSSVEFKSGSIDKFGVRNNEQARLFDPQYSETDVSTLMGYVDVSSPAGAATIRFNTGQLGWAFSGGGPNPVFYRGFGDPPGGTDPDAYIIPEPATFLLLTALGFLASRRR